MDFRVNKNTRAYACPEVRLELERSSAWAGNRNTGFMGGFHVAHMHARGRRSEGVSTSTNPEGRMGLRAIRQNELASGMLPSGASSQDIRQ